MRYDGETYKRKRPSVSSYDPFEAHTYGVIDKQIQGFFAQLHRHSLFLLISASFLLLEVIFLLFIIAKGWYGALFGSTLALLLTTFFSHLVLFYFLQVRKKEWIFTSKNLLQKMARDSLPKKLSPLLHHLKVGDVLEIFAQELEGAQRVHIKEGKYFSWKNLIQALHWKEFFEFKEHLLLAASQEYLHGIEKKPLDMEIHAATANVYVELASLYKKTLLSPPLHGYFLPPRTPQKKLQRARQLVMQQALQEFTILEMGAEQDPWIYAQLASCYHVLGHQDKEIKAYETLLSLHSPQNGTEPHSTNTLREDILEKLGHLYLKNGQQKEALRIYALLLTLNGDKAQKLIRAYSSSIPFSSLNSSPSLEKEPSFSSL